MITRRPLLEQYRVSEREQKNLAILELIRRKGPITRTEISQGTDLNIVTVSNYVSNYIQRGLVIEKGMDVSTGGRRPTLVELNAKKTLAIGIDLGTTEAQDVEMVGLVADLAGHVEHRIARRRSKASVEQVLACAPEMIAALFAIEGLDRARVEGIGIGVNGVLDEAAGTIRDVSVGGIRTSYHGFRDEMESKWGMPVLMGTDATLAALGEMRLSLAKEARNLVYFYGDISCGLILNGSLYWGSGGSAGQLGITRPMEDDALSWEKSWQYLRPSGADLGIPERARKLLNDGMAPESKLLALAHGRADDVTFDLVVAAARDGDALARELIEHGAINLGVRIAYLVNLFNPEVVVLGGGLERAGSLLLEPVFRTVRRWAFEEPGSQVDLVPAQLGPDAVAVGAASLVAREVFTQV